MKRFLIIWIIALLFTRCAEEIDLQGNLESIPVVYCLLDLNSEDQFVRISRTWLLDTESSTQPPATDSLIFSEPAVIYIEKWVENIPVSTYLFTKTTLVKDSGYFPIKGQDVYMSNFKPETSIRYVLYVYFPVIKRVLSAETFTTSFPVPEDPRGDLPREITITRDRGYTTRWFSVRNAGCYQGIFTLNYLEKINDSYAFQKISLPFDNVIIDRPDELISQVLNPNRFFNGMTLNIPINPAAQRELIGMEFTLVAGGQELGMSLRTTDIRDFTLDNDFTNVDNGIGLFSSIARTWVTNLKFSDLTYEAIANDSALKPLNFKRQLSPR